MERKIETRITKMLGIERPILCGAMQWLTKAETSSALVSHCMAPQRMGRSMPSIVVILVSIFLSMFTP